MHNRKTKPSNTELQERERRELLYEQITRPLKEAEAKALARLARNRRSRRGQVVIEYRHGRGTDFRTYATSPCRDCHGGSEV